MILISGRLLACALVLATLFNIGCRKQVQTELTVFAATSLAEVMESLKLRYATLAPDVKLQIHLAGSSTLQRQIESRAPCDVFISAAREDMRLLEERGRTLAPRVFASNALAVFALPGAPRIAKLTDLTQPAIERIAVGNPRTAPVGRYAQQALRQAGVLQQLAPRLIEAEHARQVVAYVATGTTTVGVAYRTDVAADARVEAVMTIPETLHAPIRYWIAALSDAEHAHAAARFVDFMTEHETQTVLAAHGLTQVQIEAAGEVRQPPRRRDWSPVWLSLRVALLATCFASVLGVGVAVYLADHRGASRDLIAAVTDLPLVLPPTVVGLVLLELLGPRGPLGGFLDRTVGLRIPFTWAAAVLASAIMALPLMVRTARAALESVPKRYAQAASTLGASPLSAFWSVRLPLAQRGVMAGVLLCFFRALGEFGATLMVAGNIAGRTQTLPLAIYSAVFEGRSRDAVLWVLVVASLSLLGAWGAQKLARSHEA